MRITPVPSAAKPLYMQSCAWRVLLYCPVVCVAQNVDDMFTSFFLTSVCAFFVYLIMLCFVKTIQN